MIILNIFVVKAVHRAYKVRRTMQGTKSHEERDRRYERDYFLEKRSILGAPLWPYAWLLHFYYSILSPLSITSMSLSNWGSQDSYNPSGIYSSALIGSNTVKILLTYKFTHIKI